MMTTLLNTRLHLLLLGLLSLLLLPACAVTGNYKLRGRVIEGPQSMIKVVSPDDRLLQQPGIANTPIDLTIDPRSVNRSFVRDLSGENGDFEIAIKETGAGFLRYELQVQARQVGYLSILDSVDLPSENDRLIIMMAPGRDRGAPLPDIKSGN